VLAGEEGRGGARRRRPARRNVGPPAGRLQSGAHCHLVRGGPLSSDVETLTAGLRTLVESVYPGLRRTGLAGEIMLSLISVQDYWAVELDSAGSGRE
jgi:hypothetical protein